MFMVVGTFTGQTVFSKEVKGHYGLNVQQEFEFCTIQSNCVPLKITCRKKP